MESNFTYHGLSSGNISYIISHVFHAPDGNNGIVRRSFIEAEALGRNSKTGKQWKKPNKRLDEKMNSSVASLASDPFP